MSHNPEHRKEIIRMASEAGVSTVNDQQIKFEGPMWLCLERFAALVAAAEREACAKVCEEQLIYFTPIPCPDKISGCLVDHHGPVQRKKTATECAAAIRARGEV